MAIFDESTLNNLLLLIILQALFSINTFSIKLANEEAYLEQQITYYFGKFDSMNYYY